jgi:HEAT repeat protein
MLQDSSEEVRLSTVWALGAIGDPQAVEPLAKQLEGHGLEVQLKAAQALCKINDRRALDLCLGILKSDTHEKVREMVARFLWLNGMPESTGILVKLTEDRSQSVRRAALRALEDLRAPETVPVIQLIAETRSENAFLREVAIDALQAIGNEDCIEIIGSVLLDKEDSDDVRIHAGLALGHMGGQHAVDQLKLALSDEKGSVRGVAIDSLATAGTSDVAGVIEGCLNDQDPKVRERAEKALERLKRKAAARASDSESDWW